MNFRIAWILAVFTVACFLPALSHGQMIVAHRGASAEAPENTMAAFDLAWERGADAIEGDFYLTNDHQIVCFHDKTTKRTTGGKTELSIEKSTYQELSSLDVGSWKHAKYQGEKIPTLKQVLASVPEEKQIFVEIKSGPQIVPYLKTELENSGLSANQITLISFNADVIQQSRLLMPQYKANWLTSFKQNKQKTTWSPAPQNVLEKLKRIGATGLGCSAKPDAVTKDFYQLLQQSGFELHVWTVNQPELAQYFQNLGVRSITTDRPAFIRNSIN